MGNKMDENENKAYASGLGTGTLVGVGIAILASLIVTGISKSVDYFSRNIIPDTSRVEQGYVIPSKLEIKVMDLDGKGRGQTVLRYDGKNYLLKLQGDLQKPTVLDYEIKPAQVIQK